MATKKTSKTSAAKKTPVKKTTPALATQAPAKKTPAKKAAAKKTGASKSAETKTTSEMAIPRVPAAPGTGPLTGKIGKNAHFTPAQLQELMDRLLILRERISGEILSISRDSLAQNERDPSVSDQGTDTFDREFALNQLSNEQDVLFEIDEAIRRIENGTYGVCELKEVPINIERLQALPYVRYSVAAQAELEKGRGTTYRPFGASFRG